MARKKANLKFRLAALNRLFIDDLRLPSLRSDPPRVEGFAFRFFLVLPLYCAEGNRVFTDRQLVSIYQFFDDRFGGCLVASSRSGAPFFGEYAPEADDQPVRDYHTVVIVYANPIEASDQLFKALKPILRSVPLIPQDEILIERTESYLI